MEAPTCPGKRTGVEETSRPGRLVGEETGDGGAGGIPVATYTVGNREDVPSVERFAARVEISTADPIAATTAEKARVAVYVVFALAASAFLLATLVLYLE
jgi:hypothetical protein